MAVEGEHQGSTPMFGIFLLSMYSLVLIPLTLYRLGGGGGDEGEVVQTWATKGDKGKRRGEPLAARLKAAFGGRMLVAWLAWGALLWYVQASMGSIENFDPFAILQVPVDATEAEIKKAYRKLSLQYHPDKNPDPAAHTYFATYIAKAYKALTDEVARTNYQKYGHPDGPQAVTVSVALPEWFFSKDKQAAPVILLTLLFGGIITPLGIAAWYLTRTQKYVGPNQLMEETLALFYDPRYGIKASQALGRLPETLVCAMEFICLPTPPDQGPAMDDLRKAVLRLHPDLRDKAPFWKRRTSVLKVHMLLLAHLSREGVGEPLRRDLAFLLAKALPMLTEMLGMTMGRVQPGWGWLTPAVGCIELMQCIVQAVPLAAKKAASVGKSSESPAALLQLPGFDGEVLRKLGRRKIKTLPELQALSVEERAEALAGAGLSVGDVEGVETMLSAMPTLWATAQCVVEAAPGVEDEVVMEGDVVTCRVTLMLTRPSHMAAAFDPDSIKGKAALAYAPRYPQPKEEHWYFLVADPAQNAVLTMGRQNLLQAEAIGARYAATWSAKHTTAAVAHVAANGAANGGAGGGGAKEGGEAPLNPLLAGTKFDPFAAPGGGGGGGGKEALDSPLEDLGQTFELKFIAPLSAGRYDLQLYCMPDSWVGCDRAVPLRLKVEPVTRADREGRGRRAELLQRSEESELLMKHSRYGASDVESDAGWSEDEGGSGGGSGSGESDADSAEYEYGTEESESEGEE